MSQEKSLSERLEEGRIIIVSGYIDSGKATQIILQLLNFNAKNEKEDIQLFIGSEGGSYLDMMAIYDTIQMIKAPVLGVCIGMANGYAALLLSACTKGKRFGLRHSKISIEQPYGFVQQGANQQTEIEIEAKEVSLERDIFEKAFAATTQQEISKIHRDCETGIELDAQQALEYGIIDGIID